MAIAPAQYNLRPQRRADYLLSLVFKDSTETPINLTGWQVLSQIWTKDRATKLGDMTVTVTDAPAGKVNLLIPYTLTETLPAESRYDVLLIAPGPNGLREFYLEGFVRPSEGYTAPD